MTVSRQASCRPRLQLDQGSWRWTANCILGAVGQDFFDSGDDNDRLRYDGSCGATGLAAEGKAGFGNGDEYGAAVVFGGYPWGFCESNLTGSAPTTGP